MTTSRDQRRYEDLERELHAERVEHARTRHERDSARRSAALNRALLGEALAICRGCDRCHPPPDLEEAPASS